MAKDDFHIVVYKLLLYLYGCFKRKICFDTNVFNNIFKDINKDYLTNILITLKQEGYITALEFIKVWGNEYIIVSDLNEITITIKGIEYLKENSIMSKIKNILFNQNDIISSLIKILF